MLSNVLDFLVYCCLWFYNGILGGWGWFTSSWSHFVQSYILPHQTVIATSLFVLLGGVFGLLLLHEIFSLQRKIFKLAVNQNALRGVVIQNARQISSWQQREADGNQVAQALIDKLEETNQIVEIQVNKLKQSLQAQLEATIKAFESEYRESSVTFMTECKDTINRITAQIHGEMKEECFAIVEQEVKKSLPQPKVKKRDRKKRNTSVEKTIL